MAIEMRAAERDYHRHREQVPRDSRCLRYLTATGYPAAPPDIARPIMEPPPRPGAPASSRNFYTNVSMSGGGHGRKPWLKPVSSLLRGIPESKRGHLVANSGGSIVSRYPTAGVLPPPAPCAHRVTSDNSTTPFNRMPSSALRPSNHLGDASVMSRGDAFSPRRARIEVPSASFPSRIDGGGTGRNNGRISPPNVRAPDVYVSGMMAQFDVTSTTPNDHHLHHRQYNMPSPTKRYYPAEQHLDLPSPTKRHHSVRPDFAQSQSPSSSSLSPRGFSSGGFMKQRRPFDFADDSVRDNDNNFNCANRHMKFAAGCTVSARRGEHFYAPPAPRRPPPAEPLAVVIGEPSTSRRNRELCVFDGCGKRPTHAKRGEKPSCCLEHRSGGMVDVVRRNRCVTPGCDKPPRYALPGEKAEYCSQHKTDNCVDVKHPRCESEQGCVRQPTFGWEGEKARFCSAHKLDGMLDVKNPRCAESGCMKRPRYGEEGERARFCAAHKFDNMVDLATRRGSSKCNSPTKRSRDGPRAFAHDSADAASSGPRHRSTPSLDLAAVGGGTPAPKRGHTPAHAGGHRRATSESWIDFCPKRLFDTTVRSGDDWCGRKSDIHLSEVEPAVITNDNSDNNNNNSNIGRNLRVEGEAELPKDTPHGTTAAGSGGGGGGGGVAATVALAPASLPSHSSPASSKTGHSKGQARPASGPSAAGNRFDAMDYEASAILLECRSGALLPPE